MTLNYLASNYEESKIIKIKVFKGPETKKVEQTKDLLKNCLLSLKFG